MHPEPHRLAEREEALSEFHPAFEIAYRTLPRDNFLNWRGLQQPIGKPLFSRPCPCRAKKLKKRRSTEEIEIPRVRMLRVKESFPLLPASCPTALEPCQSALVKLNRALPE